MECVSQQGVCIDHVGQPDFDRVNANFELPSPTTRRNVQAYLRALEEINLWRVGLFCELCVPDKLQEWTNYIGWH